MPFSEPQAQVSLGEKDAELCENATFWKVKWTHTKPPSSELWSEILVYSRYDHQVAEGTRERRGNQSGWVPSSIRGVFPLLMGMVRWEAYARSGRALGQLYIL